MRGQSAAFIERRARGHTAVEVPAGTNRFPHRIRKVGQVEKSRAEEKTLGALLENPP